MSDLDLVRRAALALPEAIEQDHHGMPSYRVGGRIFATVPDADHLRVFVAAEAIAEVVAQRPDCCTVGTWGAKASNVTVDLAAADDDLVRELLTDAWIHRAPATVRRALDG